MYFVTKVEIPNHSRKIHTKIILSNLGGPSIIISYLHGLSRLKHFELVTRQKEKKARSYSLLQPFNLWSFENPGVASWLQAKGHLAFFSFFFLFGEKAKNRLWWPYTHTHEIYSDVPKAKVCYFASLPRTRSMLYLDLSLFSHTQRKLSVGWLFF
jgi:hypothetical protein